jgi:micrococcal nuclease
MKKYILLLIVFALLSCSPSSNESNYITNSFYWDGSFPPPSLDVIDLSLYNQTMPDYYGYIIDTADGDTFYVDWFSEDKMGVRVKGIDTPETVDRRSDVQYWGPEASAYAKSILTPGTLVRLKFEGNITGPFGRLLAYVWYWNGQEWIYWNQQVLESGNAFVYIDYEFEYPNEYMEYQQYAIDNELGIWAHPELIENDVATSKEEFAEKKYWYRKNYY